MTDIPEVHEDEAGIVVFKHVKVFAHDDANAESAIETEAEKLRTRMGEMAAEVERLTAENARLKSSHSITEQDDKTISSNTSEWSQRITEQDAREIAISVLKFTGWKNKTEINFSDWFNGWGGRALLDKLNGAKNAQ